MKSLIELDKEIASDAQEIQKLNKGIAELTVKLNTSRALLDKAERDLAQKKISLCHIQEIFRSAQYQFSRLRRSSESSLTTTDVQEIDKWVNRATSDDGLISIKNALTELNKYKPSEIKSNLYALIQRIIIGGAYHQRKK
jgi:Skp family chaperone for outer membrane proteins